MTYKAFVSSTFEDLKQHRRHVITELRSAGFFVDPMEDWTAATNEPSILSQERVSGCDLCILLVGFRRGHVPKGEQRSITQLEYEAARQLGMDVLVFMLDEQAPWIRKFDERDRDPEVERWRAELREVKTCSSFGLEPHSIQIAPAFARWLQSRSAAKKDESDPKSYWEKMELGISGLEKCKDDRRWLRPTFVGLLAVFFALMFCGSMTLISEWVSSKRLGIFFILISLVCLPVLYRFLIRVENCREIVVSLATAVRLRNLSATQREINRIECCVHIKDLLRNVE